MGTCTTATLQGLKKGNFMAPPSTFVQAAPGSGLSGADAPGGTHSLGKPPWGWRKQPGRALCVTAVIFFSQLCPLLKGSGYVCYLSPSHAKTETYQKSEIRGTGRKEWKFLNIPEVIIGLKIVTFCMKGGKRRMRPVFLASSASEIIWPYSPSF